jgi:GMP synthase-like glutamine amidotransferase
VGLKVQVWRHHLEDNGGLLVAAYEARGATVTSQLVGPFGAPSDEACDVLIVLGSSESVYDESVQEEWLNREMTRMAELIDAGTRVFGVCFGGQMLTVVASSRHRDPRSWGSPILKS